MAWVASGKEDYPAVGVETRQFGRQCSLEVGPLGVRGKSLEGEASKQLPVVYPLKREERGMYSNKYNMPQGV